MLGEVQVIQDDFGLHLTVSSLLRILNLPWFRESNFLSKLQPHRHQTPHKRQNLSIRIRNSIEKCTRRART